MALNDVLEYPNSLEDESEISEVLISSSDDTSDPTPALGDTSFVSLDPRHMFMLDVFA